MNFTLCSPFLFVVNEYSSSSILAVHSFLYSSLSQSRKNISTSSLQSIDIQLSVIVFQFFVKEMFASDISAHQAP
jgi:hypothetical protein